MEGNSGNGNPFAYAHALQFRPWVHYDGIAHLTVTGAVSYIYYFTVPGTSYYRHPEWRFTAFGTLKQQPNGGSLYEQLRFALLSLRASSGDVQQLPRVRVRFGQNLYLSEHPSRPYLGVYESRPLYAAASVGLVHEPAPQDELVDARKGVESATARVKELTASLDRMMGWPEETELDLEVPDPLVENTSFEDVADKPVAGNPEVLEAEQTVVKARAAAVLSKLAYVPTVAAVGGYAFQNAFPLVLSNLGYGGVMASYTLFDFGKREHAVKEARAHLEMAEIALPAAKAKSSGELKKSYHELERARQPSNVAQRMGVRRRLC